MSNRRLRARSDLAADTYARLRDLIVEGRLAPGSVVTETELSFRLGVSRTPLRVALAQLKREALVVQPASGQRLTVSPLTAADMAELFMIVGVLEGLAARLAAELPEDSRLPLAREMRRLNQGLRAASRKRPRDIVAAKDLHVQFHRATVTAAGPRLRTKLDGLHSQWERYERAYTSVIVHEFDQSLREHDAIVEAIQAGDPEAAERAVICNYRHGSERCQRVVALIGERGAW